MTPMQILNQLYADKKITLAFESESARESFRQKIYKIKKKQDAAMSAVLDEEKLTLCTKKVDKENAGFDSLLLKKLEVECCKLVLWTEEKKAQAFTIISVEDREANDVGQNHDADPSISSDSEDVQQTLGQDHGQSNNSS